MKKHRFLLTILCFSGLSIMAQKTIKEKAIAIPVDGVAKADKNVINKYISDAYIQHHPKVPDGKEGVMLLIDRIRDGKVPAPKIKVKRAIEDKGYVVLHSEFNWPNQKSAFEIFRFEDGMAKEHWMSITDHPESTASGNTMLDGETRIRDRDKTEENKRIARDFIQTVFIEGNFDRAAEFNHPDFIQHNPYVENGVAGLKKGIENLKNQGIEVAIQKIHLVLGEGNFVFLLSEGKFGGKPTAFYDLYRLKDGKIAEHWDVLMEVPEQMAHDNGMFVKSLYERLGGYDRIAQFVGTAFPRVATHPDLEHLFKSHSLDTQNKQFVLIIERLCSAAGSPVPYIGRPLKTVHRGLNITDAEWGTFMEIITNAIDELKFPSPEREEFLEIFEHFKSVTVEAELSGK